MTDITNLLKRYDAWDAQRTINSEREEDDPVSSGTWADSDDEGVSLAHELAGVLRRETLCLICKEPVRLSWIHPRSNGNHGSLECGTGDGSIATPSDTPAPPVPREIWTCTVKTPHSPTPVATVHASEDDAIESLRTHYDDGGEFEGLDIVAELEAEGYFINVDVHTI